MFVEKGISAETHADIELLRRRTKFLEALQWISRHLVRRVFKGGVYIPVLETRLSRMVKICLRLTRLARVYPRD